MAAFLAFCPITLGGGRDLRMMVFLENECSFSGGHKHSC